MSERQVPFMGSTEKCIHGNEKGMGCCGYDELAVKPATTTPITFGARPRAARKDEAEMGERPRIQAKPLPSSDIQLPQSPQGIPVQTNMGGRIPDGNFGVGSQVRSIFDVPKGRRQEAPTRPRILAKALGQETPPPSQTETQAPPSPTPAPPPATTERVQAVLQRESPPEGLVKKEAAELASALTPAIENSALALAEGKQCAGVDDSSLKKAGSLRDGLLRFATQAPENARLEIEPADIALIEQVLECSDLYEAQKKAATEKTVAFVLGGLLIGTVVLVLTSRA